MTITVRYSSIDGYRKTRTFKTLKGAQKLAHRYVGETPELGSTYAVSFDGIGKITCEGCTLLDLFPALIEPTDTDGHDPESLYGDGFGYTGEPDGNIDY